jgi:hypothetical protein
MTGGAASPEVPVLVGFTIGGVAYVIDLGAHAGANAGDGELAYRVALEDAAALLLG